MGKRYCLLSCEDADKWKGFEQYFKRLFEQDATWDVFKCYLFDLPKAEQLAEYDGVFISGSHCSAYDNVTWIKQLRAYLRNALQHKKVPAKVVGICFGSQVLAEALGGKVGKNPDGGFVLKGVHPNLPIYMAFLSSVRLMPQGLLHTLRLEDVQFLPHAFVRPDCAALLASPADGCSPSPTRHAAAQPHASTSLNMPGSATDTQQERAEEATMPAALVGEQGATSSKTAAMATWHPHGADTDMQQQQEQQHDEQQGAGCGDNQHQRQQGQMDEGAVQQGAVPGGERSEPQQGLAQQGLPQPEPNVSGDDITGTGDPSGLRPGPSVEAQSAKQSGAQLQLATDPGPFNTVTENAARHTASAVFATSDMTPALPLPLSSSSTGMPGLPPTTATSIISLSSEPLSNNSNPAAPSLPCQTPSSSTHVPRLVPHHTGLRLVESHGDQVLQLPPDAELLAVSGTAAAEIWAWQDSVLAIQGHPELDNQSVLDKILPARASNGRLSDAEAAASRASLQSVAPDQERALQLIKAFLAAPRPMQRTAVPPPLGPGSPQANTEASGGEQAVGPGGPAQRSAAALWTRVTSWPALRGRFDKVPGAQGAHQAPAQAPAVSPDGQQDEPASVTNCAAEPAAAAAVGAGTGAIAASARTASSPAVMQKNNATEPKKPETSTSKLPGAVPGRWSGTAEGGAGALQSLWAKMATLQASLAAAVPSKTGTPGHIKQDAEESTTLAESGTGVLAAAGPDRRSDVDGSIPVDSQAAPALSQVSAEGRNKPKGAVGASYSFAQGMLRGITALLPPAMRDGATGSTGPPGAPPSPGPSVAPSDGDPAEKEAILLHKADMAIHHLSRAVECEVRQAILDMDTLTECNRAVARRYNGMGAYATGMSAFMQALSVKCEPLTTELLPAVRHVEGLLEDVEGKVEALEALTASLCEQLGIAEGGPGPTEAFR